MDCLNIFLIAKSLAIFFILAISRSLLSFSSLSFVCLSCSNLSCSFLLCSSSYCFRTFLISSSTSNMALFLAFTCSSFSCARNLFSNSSFALRERVRFLAACVNSNSYSSTIIFCTSSARSSLLTSYCNKLATLAFPFTVFNTAARLCFLLARARSKSA